VVKIMVALDPLPEVLEAAIQNGCQLLVTHHPLIFSPLRQVTTTGSTGQSVTRAISAGLSIISMHTNYDIAEGGLNDLLASRIGLADLRPLKVTGRAELVKLVVFVPEDALEKVRTALLPHGLSIGNYRDCSFAASGDGTFLPIEGARPSIGEVGRLEQVAERRLELLISRDSISKVLRQLMAVHPYEEPAYDLYPLLNEGQPVGLGRIGRLAAPYSMEQYAAVVAKGLGCKQVRCSGARVDAVRKVALCSGSGASLLRDAARAGADLLVTGDVKYHDAREAEALGIGLIDAGHFATEVIMVEAVSSRLKDELAELRLEAEVIAYGGESDPFRIVENSSQV
jgi:dinuclear metal center YbgI/SA1388 family protein